MKNNYFNIFLISGSGLIGGLINYIYHPIMLQYLSIEEFGEFGSLIGLFSILGVLTSGITLFLTKEISRNISDTSRVKGIYAISTKYLIGIGTLVFLLFLPFSPFIAEYLRIHIGFVLLVSTVIFTSFLGVSMSSVFVGLRKFEFLGFNTIFHPIQKLIIGLIGVSLGFGIGGAVGGFVLSGVLSLGVNYLYIRYIFSGVREKEESRHMNQIFEGKTASFIQFILVSVFFSFLMNADVILVRNIFPPEIAGAYAGVSIVGKFLLFVLLTVETVYYGQIIEHSKKNAPPHLVRNVLIIMILLSLGAILVNLGLGGFILASLGKGLDMYLDVYIILLIYYGLLAFVSIFSKILIAWAVHSVNTILAIMSGLFIVSAYLYGSGSLIEFSHVILIVLFGGTTAIASLFFWHFIGRHS